MEKRPLESTQEEAGRIAAQVLTIGEEEFGAAETLVRSGQIAEAITEFERLTTKCRGSWIDRVATERLKTLRSSNDKEMP